MKRKFIYMALLLICISLAAIPVMSASDSTQTQAAVKTKPAEAIKWYDYQDGLKQMKEGHKKGFVHFYTDWCTYCKLMNRQTFTDKSVIAYLNENFIPIRINAEKERDVAQKYGVNRFPTNFFMAEDGSLIGNRPGFIPSDLMLSMLKYINTDSFKTISFADFMEKKN